MIFTMVVAQLALLQMDYTQVEHTLRELTTIVLQSLRLQPRLAPAVAFGVVVLNSLVFEKLPIH
jgi:hypothetical protein